MEIRKVRFLEPGNLPYRRSIKNLYTYEQTIRNPSIGLLTLATIVKAEVGDTLMYSESISKIVWEDVLDADVIFLGLFTFVAPRGYELARHIKERSDAVVVLGGLHASMHYTEAVRYCDFVLLGEGDESVLKLLDCLRRDGPPDMTGVAYLRGEELVHTGDREPPQNIDTVPDRHLLYRYHKMAGHNTLWPQVHASRGCPHSCDYCAVVRHFGRAVRTRSPDNVLEDIRQAIDFHDKRRIPRLSRYVWLTDDNFFADRDWAVAVLRAIIDSGLRYAFTVQARYEVGFDDEMLELLRVAGFEELAMGIEFLEDEAFALYHKTSRYEEIVRSVRNIQRHGLRVRGLFIMGADNHTEGVGTRLAEFVEAHDIRGVLIQSMYFVPGTPVYEQSKDRLLHEDWSKCTGHVVHYPERLTPSQLQQEIITASKKIYSAQHLLRALLRYPLREKILYVGEFFWQKSVRKRLRQELPFLAAFDAPQRSRGVAPHPTTFP